MRLMSPQRRRRLGFAVAGWTVTLALVAPFLWMVLGSLKGAKKHRRREAATALVLDADIR